MVKSVQWIFTDFTDHEPAASIRSRIERLLLA
jgi:hypothetical protein